MSSFRPWMVEAVSYICNSLKVNLHSQSGLIHQVKCISDQLRYTLHRAGCHVSWGVAVAELATRKESSTEIFRCIESKIKDETRTIAVSGQHFN